MKGGQPTWELHFAATHPTTNKPKRKSRRYHQRRQKRQLGKAKKKQTRTIATEEKIFQLRSEQITTTIETKLKQQFGFVADPKKTLLHNASSALANISRNKNNHQRTYVHSWVSDSNLFRRHISQTYGRN